MEIPIVRWMPIPGYQGYEASERGDVRHNGCLLKPERTHGNGRRRFSLSKDGVVRRYKAAQLVLMAFVGPKPFCGAEACHNDGVEVNDHISNLRWGSKASNMADEIVHRIQRRSLSLVPLSRQETLAAETAKFLAENA
jgi:hypothetical protein